ncbi:TetR/AcrR family transcriptional regulator [Paenibacillus solisilvae]|uniref:TetR/AcrR family transcriptional regulator n=1 Tax=Paenibacillus solisilvae TaxID=2486751 RepID=A0ABW0VT21_9BACL
MNSNTGNDTNPQKEMRNKLVNKVLPIIVKNGFQSLRMEEISKYMDVSKATMYKYFASKDEVLESIVASLIDYINELVVKFCDTCQSYGTGFQQLFEQSLLLAAYISDVFLTELQAMYPELHSHVTDAMRLREKHILQFYQEGQNKHIFNEFNGYLIFLQDNVLVRAMLDIKFLMSYHLTLNQVLVDYYQLMKHQLFRPEQLHTVDDTKFTSKLDFLANKITRDLF